MNLKFVLFVLLLGAVSIEARRFGGGGSRGGGAGRIGGVGHSYGGGPRGTSYGGGSRGSSHGSLIHHQQPYNSGGYIGQSNVGGSRGSSPQHVPAPQPNVGSSGGQSGLGSVGTHVAAAAGGAVLGGMLSRPNHYHNHQYVNQPTTATTTTVQPTTFTTTVQPTTVTSTETTDKKRNFYDFLRENGENVVITSTSTSQPTTSQKTPLRTTRATRTTSTTQIPTTVDPKIAEKEREAHYRASKAELIELIQDIKWAQEDPEHVAKVNVLKKEVKEYEKEKKMY